MNEEGPAKKLRKRDREGSKSRLLTAAERQFAAQGIPSTTTKQIAREARCGEALIANYFGGKSGLVLCLAHLRANASEASFRDFLNRPALNSLRQEIMETLDFLERHLELNADALICFMPASFYDNSYISFVAKLTGQAYISAFAERFSETWPGRKRHVAPVDAAAKEVIAIAVRRFFVRRELIGFSGTSLDVSDEADLLYDTILEVWQ